MRTEAEVADELWSNYVGSYKDPKYFAALVAEAVQIGVERERAASREALDRSQNQTIEALAIAKRMSEAHDSLRGSFDELNRSFERMEGVAKNAIGIADRSLGRSPV